MDNERKYTTSLRLYKERPVHAQAYRCLKNYNRDIFKTKDDFIAEAIIHFSRYLKQEEEEKQHTFWICIPAGRIIPPSAVSVTGLLY